MRKSERFFAGFSDRDDPNAHPSDPGRSLPRLFPFEPARDLLGILRALYAYEKAKPFPANAEAPQESNASPGSPARCSAPSSTTRGRRRTNAPSHAPTASLIESADVVDIVDPLEPVLKAASDRVRGRKPKEQERRFQWTTGKRRG